MKNIKIFSILIAFTLLSFSCTTGLASFNLSEVEYTNLEFPEITTTNIIQNLGGTVHLATYGKIGESYQLAKNVLPLYFGYYSSWKLEDEDDSDRYTRILDPELATNLLINEFLSDKELFPNLQDQGIKNLFTQYNVVKPKFLLTYTLWDFFVIDARTSKNFPVKTVIEWTLHDALTKGEMITKRVETVIQSEYTVYNRKKPERTDFKLPDIFASSVKTNLNQFLTLPEVVEIIK